MTATALAEPQRAERARAAPAARRSSAPARRPRAPVQREHELHVVGARRLAPLRRKLEVGRSDDPVEHEADRVAARVLAAPVLRRACACGGTPGPDGECAAYHARSSCGGPPHCSSPKVWLMSLVPYIDSRSKQGAPQTAALKRSVWPIAQAVM